MTERLGHHCARPVGRRFARFLTRLEKSRSASMTRDSHDNTPPASPPLPSPSRSPSPSPLPSQPQEPQQPPPHKSAWWIVGFLAPVLVAIIGLIGVLIANKPEPASREDSKPPNDATESRESALPGASKPSTGTTTSSSSMPSNSGGSTKGPPPEVRFGPDILDFPGDENIDLDSRPPLLIGTLTRGTDVGFYGDRTSLSTLNGESRLAPLPPSGPDPSEAECVAAVQANGTYHLPLTRGARYCAISRDGRTAYLRAVAAPAEGTIRLEVTVWEIPG